VRSSVPAVQAVRERAEAAIAGTPVGVPGPADGRTRDALDRTWLLTRGLHEARKPDTSFEWLGATLTAPLLAAPLSGLDQLSGGIVGDGEYFDTVARAIRAKGGFALAGHGAWLELGPQWPEWDVAAPVFHPVNMDILMPLVRQAAERGVPAIGLAMDALAEPVATRRWEVSPKSRDELSELVAAAGRPFILTGVTDPRDALIAAEAGVEAVAVTNEWRGGFDAAPPVPYVLPEVLDAVAGAVLVLAGGGIASGADLLRYLALGADAVLLRRTLLRAAIGGGREGVELYLDEYRAQLIAGMVQTGCEDLGQITYDCIFEPTFLEGST
jgi:isopentenyl diphosphate isomerase/L-lactate dehydrogenase-like FMN-dependent dehydrogenase